jgi:hypothetical protein
VVGGVEGVGQRVAVEQVAVGVELIDRLAVQLGQPVGGVVLVGGGVAVDDLLQAVTDRVVAVSICLAGGVIGFG